MTARAIGPKCSCGARRVDGSCPYGCDVIAAEKRAAQAKRREQRAHQQREEHSPIVSARSLRPVMRRAFTETVERQEKAGLIRRPRSQRKGER